MSTINCIGFIMDGNRRWAEEKGLSTLEGHKQGFKTFKDTVESVTRAGIKNSVFYTFSTENWKRAKKEVTYLIQLFESAFNSMDLAHENKLRVRFLGQIKRFPRHLQKLIAKLEKDTEDYMNGTVWVALSYGGRPEIVNAVNDILKENKKREITEEDIQKHLWTKDMPDPDIIVRTGDAMRLSNFLPWQSVYSELYFTKTYWPDFNKKELENILNNFGKRERRLGK